MKKSLLYTTAIPMAVWISVLLMVNSCTDSGQNTYRSLDEETTSSAALYRSQPLVPEDPKNTPIRKSSLDVSAWKAASLNDINLQQYVFVGGGDYIMGDSKTTNNGYTPHRVRVKSFYIDKYEVTNLEFCAFLNDTPDKPDYLTDWLHVNNEHCRIKVIGDTYVVDPFFSDDPAVCVSWEGAIAYARWADKRLPTEAEWEYAARGGILGKKSFTYAGSNQADEVAWYRENAAFSTHQVGRKEANPLGLYDMSGNVWEWCADFYQPEYMLMREGKTHLARINPKGPQTGTHRVIRGGSWLEGPQTLSPAYRGYGDPLNGQADIGFRCVKDFEPI
ncbi:MAG: formylglycine-generating enzyme family protein [Bacteroidota bacterium]